LSRRTSGARVYGAWYPVVRSLRSRTTGYSPAHLRCAKSTRHWDRIAD